jgi:hypothetical protein
VASNWPLVVPGDAEAAVVDILTNYTPELSGLDITFSTSMVGYTAGDRWVVVSQEGGSAEWPKIDRPRIDLQIFANSRTDARDIAAMCQASLIRSMGNYSGNGVTITDVRLELGLTRVPDKLEEVARYILALRLTCVPYGEPLLPS